MLGGRDRNAVCPVDAVLFTAVCEVRELFGEVKRRDVQRHLTGRLSLRLDCPGHHVAGREFGVRVVVGHEPLALAVAQQTTLAADGFADEEGHVARSGGPPPPSEPRVARYRAYGRRVELHVLHVLDLGSGERGHADAVTGRVVGVRRPRVEVADAAGRQHDAAGEVRVDLAVGFEHRAVDPPLVTDEFERGGVVQNLHAVVVVE